MRLSWQVCCKENIWPNWLQCFAVGGKSKRIIATHDGSRFIYKCPHIFEGSLLQVLREKDNFPTRHLFVHFLLHQTSTQTDMERVVNGWFEIHLRKAAQGSFKPIRSRGKDWNHFLPRKHPVLIKVGRLSLLSCYMCNYS